MQPPAAVKSGLPDRLLVARIDQFKSAQICRNFIPAAPLYEYEASRVAMNLSIIRDSRFFWFSLVAVLLVGACGQPRASTTGSPTSTPSSTVLATAPPTCPSPMPVSTVPALQSATPNPGAISSATWSLRGSRPLPIGHGKPLMAYDEEHNQVVMYVNRDPGSSDLGVTWTWNGTDWAEADRRGDFIGEAMVYDAKLAGVVAFSFAWRTPEYYVWTGSTWSPPQTGGPTPRFGEAVAYDPVSGNVVVFGGSDWYAGSPLGDTWTWDGSQWIQQHPTTSPTPRQQAMIMYDPSSKKLLLFGGLTSTGWSTETWTWNGSIWTRLAPVASPPGMSYVGATDPASGGPLVIGQTPSNWEQWRWAGFTWQAQAVGVHPDRLPTATAYDKANHNTVAVTTTGECQPIVTWVLG